MDDSCQTQPEIAHGNVMRVRVLCFSYCWIAANCRALWNEIRKESYHNTTGWRITLIESEFLKVWRQNVTRVTSYWPLSQFTLGCLGCTVWMYAKLFHEKLCHLMLCCINWPNTVQFRLGLPHLTPRWTVSPDSVPFYAQLLHLSLYQLLLCSAILCNAIPFDITLAKVELCCVPWTLIGSLFVLWHDRIFFCVPFNKLELNYLNLDWINRVFVVPFRQGRLDSF